MKIIPIIKNVTFILFITLLITSCRDEKKGVEETDSVKNENEKVIEVNEPDTDQKAFNTRRTSKYDAKNGEAVRNIWIPTELLSDGSRDASYNLSLISQKDISDSGNYIIFELYQNGNSVKLEMKSNLVNQNDSWKIKDIIPTFDLLLKKPVHIVSYHDEDFMTYSDEVKNKIYNYIQNTIKDCINNSGVDCARQIKEEAIVKIISSNQISNIQPNTIGGGVIPPK